MKINKCIFYGIIILFIFINCDIYAYEKTFENDLLLNNIYNEGSIYDYDLYWENMSFTYIENKSFEYNEESHDYDLILNGSWSNNSNKVSITNNSITNINVSLMYESIDLYNNVTGLFTPNDFDVRYNETVESSLELNGSINDNNDSLFEIGTITIRIQ